VQRSIDEWGFFGGWDGSGAKSDLRAFVSVDDLPAFGASSEGPECFPDLLQPPVLGGGLTTLQLLAIGLKCGGQWSVRRKRTAEREESLHFDAQPGEPLPFLAVRWDGNTSGLKESDHPALENRPVIGLIRGWGTLG
jgi:hypothetical protein